MTQKLHDLRTILETQGFTQARFSPFKFAPKFGVYDFTKEGVEGAIELVENGPEEDNTFWAHRTPASGPGTGVRPVGGKSVKSLTKHLKGIKA